MDATTVTVDLAKDIFEAMDTCAVYSRTGPAPSCWPPNARHECRRSG